MIMCYVQLVESYLVPMNSLHRLSFTFLFVCLALFAGPVNMYAGDSLKVHTDFLFEDDKELFHELFYQSLQRYKGDVSLKCYRYTGDQDSTLMYRYRIPAQEFKKGVGSIRLSFQHRQAETYVYPAFASVVRKTGLVPPGTYKVFLAVEAGSLSIRQSYLRAIDSTLSPQSPVRKGIGKILSGDRQGFLSAAPVAKLGTAADKAGRVFERSQFKLERYCKKKGFRVQQYKNENKEIIDLYYEEWFMGRYQMPSHVSVQEQLKQEQQTVKDNIGSLADNQLGNYSSLVSQFRELKKESRENDEMSGEIGVSANFSNDQEQFSSQDNNYYEARGSLEFPLFNVPVSVAGFYTTQDRNRKAKASYIHFRYDAEKAKEQLMKLIGSYNKRYEQTITQGGNYDMIYGQFVQQMQQQKDQAIASLKQEAGLPEFDALTFNPELLKEKAAQLASEEGHKLQDSLVQSAGATKAGQTAGARVEQLKKAKRSAAEIYAKSMERYHKIMELERKIKRYQSLLEQYKNTAHYDSLLAYDKIKDMKDLESMSYKDMAKRAAHLLPEGKTKNLVTGLTHFDAGMFPQYISSYTMSGQMLKGIDIGYDVGIAEIGAGYGKTEYIDRSGDVEGYKAYSGRVKFKPLFRQQLGFVYYGYSPGKKLLSDQNFFRDADISLPSFRNPVHIISATYNGAVTSYVDIAAEYAMANKPQQSKEAREKVGLQDKSAYNINLSGNIPATGINIEAGYEYAGAAFENNTLPVIMSGTEKFRISGKGDFFKSFLRLGVEYNYLIQNSFYAKGNNARWGFEVSTHSRRFPSVYISYKPFSTFRSYNDTLDIAQKPILGEVWTGKLNYQVKKLSRALRFTLLYNRNTSIIDTLRYGSTLVQFSTIYSKGTTQLGINAGSTVINTTAYETAYPAFNNSQFVNVMAGGSLIQQLSVSGGADMARNKSGISRFGFFTGFVYTFKRMPLMLRTNFRYGNYRPDILAGWKQLYSGGVELVWRFKFKISE
jgi:hypothetical protein